MIFYRTEIGWYCNSQYTFFPLHKCQFSYSLICYTLVCIFKLAIREQLLTDNDQSLTQINRNVEINFCRNSTDR